ncbi:MAG: NAD(P)H-dependent oxidoreductase subunit E [Mogibacterium sp.]|nr:NAD(P)H-dependent oxidoreductase subunit E [Mogibacterium sp.]
MDCGMMQNNNILEIALALQNERGWVSEEDVRAIAAAKGLPESKVYETLSFYSMILLEKPAAVRIEVCRGTSCYIAEGVDLLKELQKVAGCPIGGRSEDGRYQLEYCECLGRCETAPNLIVNGRLYTSVTRDSIREIIEKEAAVSCQ